jgi:hypothetical protein
MTLLANLLGPLQPAQIAICLQRRFGDECDKGIGAAISVSHSVIDPRGILQPTPRRTTCKMNRRDFEQAVGYE